MENVVNNGRFLYSAFDALPPQAVMKLFEDRGVPLKVERGRRVFPVSDKSRDITDALARHAPPVRKARVTSLWLEDGALKGVITETGRVAADKVLIATGGMSYPVTGSTGDGYALARQAGHTIIEPRASLVPLLSDDECCRALTGLTLKNVTVNGSNSTTALQPDVSVEFLA
ncbi:hypothetical protein FACS18949_18450 [Clostridia bacterium]|nr:hypothetical protein FACS18949_18450 [Clostridia bacterium]